MIELHDKIFQIMTTHTPDIVKQFPSDSFQRLFWEQQYEAVKQKDPRTMRWHPLMIKWCLYLRHKYVCCVQWRTQVFKMHCI